jgi:hypothetical protein
MAVIHLILEMVKLYLEAAASKEKLLNYIVACYSARQGWIPEKDKISSKYKT